MEEFGHLKAALRRQLKLIHRIDEFSTVKDFKERIYLDKYMKNFIYNLLYFILLDDGKNLNLIFELENTFQKNDLDHDNNNNNENEIISKNFPNSIDDIFNDFKNDTQFYKKVKSFKLENKCHKGRNCGRKFRNGEPIYRCQECGFDETCVLCINCFEPDDHKDHHIYMDICNSDLNTGICDCGDTEAWNTNLNCKAENDSKLNTNDEKQKKLLDFFNTDKNSKLFEVVLTEILDYFIDVFNQNIEPLYTLQSDVTILLRNIYHQNSKMNNINNEQNDDTSTNDENHSLAYEKMIEFINELSYKNEYFNEIDEQSGFTVIVYNDEYHNYSQATTALRQGKPDNKHIDLLTARIDEEGKTVLKCSEKLDKSLVDSFFAVQTNGLTASIIHWSEYIHQKACKYIISWLSHCLSIEHPSFQNLFRNTLCKVLCSEYKEKNTRDLTPIIDKYFMKAANSTKVSRYNDLSVLDPNIKIPQSIQKLLNTENSEIQIPLDSLSETSIRGNINYTNSRLQFILYFDNRYWKSLRKNVQNLIVPTLASDIEYKKIFNDQFIEIINQIMNSVTFRDREPQLTILRECIVQLLTCPTNVESIVSDTKKLQNILWTIIDIFNKFTKRENGLLIWQRVQKINPTKSYTFIFRQALYLIEIVLGKVKDISVLLLPENFVTLLNFLKLFNGAWKLKRKEGEHVEHEDQHFIPYLQYTTYIYNIIEVYNVILKKHANSTDSQRMLIESIKILSNYLDRAATLNMNHRPVTYEGREYQIIKFDIDKERTSYMNPLNTLLSILLDKVSIRDFLNIMEQSKENNFINISDISLRTIILCSQIGVGFWIRNGMSVLHQISYYKGNSELDSYSRDIYIVQMTSIKACRNKTNSLLDDSTREELDAFALNIIDRWELLEWFTGNKEINDTVYEDKILPIIQQFIAFCYHLITDRQYFIGFKDFEEQKMYNIENAIIYNLYSKPLSYSKLLKAIPDYLVQHNNNQDFDIALEKLSVFEEPKGLTDSGVYRLSKKYYSRIDPLNILNMGNDFETSATTIKNCISGKSKKNQKIILDPYFPSNCDKLYVGQFSKTMPFTRFIYKLLSAAIEMSEGSYLYELLHLIHAIFKDEQILMESKKIIPDSYLEVPICELLVKIFDSQFENKFSDSIVTKANFLFEEMVSCDHDRVYETLTNTLGKDFVSSFREKNLNNNNGSDEILNELEKKKMLAKKRQQKLLQKFNNQQKKFMQGHESELVDKTDSTSKSPSANQDENIIDDEKISIEEDYTCSLCQDQVENDAFVVPAYHDYTPIFRVGDIFDIDEFAMKWNGFANNEKKAYTDEKILRSLNIDGKRGSRKVFVSCNHSVHGSCFKRFIQKKRFSVDAFICPLCQTYSNCVIPVVNSSNTSDLTWRSILTDKQSSINSLVKLIAGECVDTTKDCDTSNPMYVVVLFSTFHSNSFDADVRKSSGFQKADAASVLGVHWANTISMLEIASRLDNNPYDSYLQGREQKYRTLRNILGLILLIRQKFGEPNADFLPYAKKTDSSWTSNQPFQFIVYQLLFNKSQKSLQDVISHVVYQVSSEILNNFLDGVSLPEVDIMYSTAIETGEIYSMPDDMRECLSSPIYKGNSNDINLPNEAYHLVYTCLIRNIYPILRKCLIMLKVLHDFSPRSDSNDFYKDCCDIVGEDKNIDLVTSVDNAIKILTGKDSLKLLLNHYETQEYNKKVDEKFLNHFSFEYCGIVKLVNLAQNLNTYVTNSKDLKLREEFSLFDSNIANRLDFKICLTCGVKVHMRGDNHEMSKHLHKFCFRSYGVFLIPNKNEICLIFFYPPSTVYIPAPYLNSHGETGKNAIKRGDTTTLNLKRYEFLNNLWINNEIPGYISRIMGDNFRLNILTNGFLFAFNRPVRQRRTDDDDESDEDDDINIVDDMISEGENESDSESDVIDIANNQMIELRDDTMFGLNEEDEDNEDDDDDTENHDDARFFQVFEPFRNTVMTQVRENNQLTAPLIELFGPRFTVPRRNNALQIDDSDEDNNIQQDGNDDDDDDDDVVQGPNDPFMETDNN
ncbi:hypothetical protein Kpol_2002p93 [Vanderwaltozyma polyspora DSM 70294]|uniref:E3 ubiquitin-protein ligase n=1 Tax=Vanderwaltozyma polyspora (strain ATCC 22028 / DSM 70294 / BCRC 21397 / CBS 2163 / NBRC 10782 / NRRL Y-8283 / UCD 57-17) TaxID=436907 RepID=A7TFK8_VANPO|nr:uncharacterized protein Kpol_2002p93 [Vanderwaltozyma polyspora DSM 70294]EDO19022.1 hypothetical protein Kpol_2002p93 [Vanderwaltozyma polyspora DSM 70294]